jgi:phosphatidylinositol alpha-1,6-mannosyltransferase
MAILLVTWNFPPRRGGIENLMAQLSAGLKKNHTVFVITAYADHGCEEDVFRSPWPGLIPFALYALWRGALLLIRNRKIHVVFGGSAMVTPLVYFLARAFRRKAVVQAHGLDLVYRSIIYQGLCVRWLKHCDAVLANSNYTGMLAMERGVPREAIHVIPLGVDSERFTPAANCDELKQEFRLEGRQIILFVGRLARRKGVKEFVQNCLPVIARELPHACFVVAGGNPTESLTHCDDVLSEIEATVRDLRLQDHVRLLGEVSDDQLVKLYQCCDLVVLPALASSNDVEGFGMVLLEAGAAGKPVVATRVGGIPDAVDSGKSGILINPGDYWEVSKVIVELLAKDHRRKTIGEFARRRTQMEFSWDAVVTRYEAALVVSG